MTDQAVKAAPVLRGRRNAKRSSVVLAAGVCALALVAAGCGSSSSSGSSGGSSGSSGAGKVDGVGLALSTYPTGLHSLPYEVAIKEGFYAKNHIKITKIVGTTGGATTVRALINGNLTFGQEATSSTIQAFNSGVPLRIIGGDVSNVSDEYLVAKKGSYTSIKSLVGKKWAYTGPGSVTQLVSVLAVQREGIDPKQVNLLASGSISDGLTLVKNGGADAAIALDPSYQTLTSTYNTVASLGKIIGPFDQSVKVTSAKLIQTDPGLVKRFLAATNEGVAWIYTHPAQAGAIFAKYSGVPTADCVAAVKAELSPKHWSLALNAQGMNAVIKVSEQTGLFKPGTNWSRLIDQNFLPAGVQKLDVSQLAK